METMPAELLMHISSFGLREKARLREVALPLMGTNKKLNTLMGAYVRARAAARLMHISKAFRDMRRNYGDAVLAVWTAEHHLFRGLSQCQCGWAESEHMKYLEQRRTDKRRADELMADGEGGDYPWVDGFEWEDK
tara:strand:- start:3547 stop:3951 length:405 start_codon:yes stop_codon:yes gene_type:complete